jgi:hypothetical protein
MQASCKTVVAAVAVGSISFIAANMAASGSYYEVAKRVLKHKDISVDNMTILERKAFWKRKRSSLDCSVAAETLPLILTDYPSELTFMYGHKGRFLTRTVKTESYYKGVGKANALDRLQNIFLVAMPVQYEAGTVYNVIPRVARGSNMDAQLEIISNLKGLSELVLLTPENSLYHFPEGVSQQVAIKYPDRDHPKGKRRKFLLDQMQQTFSLSGMTTNFAPQTAKQGRGGRATWYGNEISKAALFRGANPNTLKIEEQGDGEVLRVSFSNSRDRVKLSKDALRRDPGHIDNLFVGNLHRTLKRYEIK